MQYFIGVISELNFSGQVITPSFSCTIVTWNSHNHECRMIKFCFINYLPGENLHTAGEKEKGCILKRHYSRQRKSLNSLSAIVSYQELQFS